MCDVREVFDRFDDAWKTYVGTEEDPKYWWVGNALGAALTFAEHWSAVGGDPQLLEPLKGMVNDGFEKVFPKGFNSAANWFDDHGWWGLALIQAYQRYQEPCYLSSAWEVWRRLQSRAWAAFPPVQGLPAGGCYNTDLAGQNPVQNTVVNGLYLALSARLARMGTELSRVVPQADPSICAKAAEDSYRWWSEWITPPASNQGNYLPLANNLAHPSQTVWLVRDTATPLDGKNPYLQCVITQEQGLLIAGLAELVALRPNVSFSGVTIEPETLLHNVVGAVQNPFFPGPSEVVQEPPFSFQFGKSPLGDFTSDESTGRGGLLRFLSRYRNVVGATYDEPFEKTAEAAWNANQASQLNPDWVGCTDRRAAVAIWEALWGIEPGQSLPGFGDPFLLTCESNGCSECLFAPNIDSVEAWTFLCRTNELDAMSAVLSNSSRLKA